MDIQEFIREALAQVISGIAAAKEATKNNGHAEINPLLLRIKTPVEGSSYLDNKMDAENLKGSGLLMTDEINYVASMIEFDIAVTVESKAGKTAEDSGKLDLGAKI